MACMPPTRMADVARPCPRWALSRWIGMAKNSQAAIWERPSRSGHAAGHLVQVATALAWTRVAQVAAHMRLAAASPIITQVKCRLARQSVGIIDASATRSPSTPRTLSSGSTTPLASP